MHGDPVKEQIMSSICLTDLTLEPLLETKMIQWLLHHIFVQEWQTTGSDKF
jgi:hypothetical protein